MSAAERTLSNVLICAGGNMLAPAHVRFADKIQSIECNAADAIELSTIAQREEWLAYRKRCLSQPMCRDRHSFDGEGLLLIPGAVDAHVHFDTPGYEDREDVEHASRAAVCGGVTTVADMPCTSVPPVTSRDALQQKRSVLASRSKVNMAMWGGISSQVLRDPQSAEQHVRDLAEDSVIGFKCYMTSGMSAFGELDRDELTLAARLAKTVNLPLAVHAEERSLVRSREESFRREGRCDWRAYCESRDDHAEARAIEILLDVARENGAHIHIVHLSSCRGLECVARAQTESLNVTAETCPHYLHFTEQDFERPEISAFLKTAPPVKSAEDREALWTGLRDRTLSFVTTDHAGCNPSVEKSSEDFWEVYGGIPGVEHRIPYLLSEGVLKNRLTLERAIELLCAAPAQFLGIAMRKGFLKKGIDADFALVDLWSENVISSTTMHSKGRYTPFEGLRLSASVRRTWMNGVDVTASEFLHGEFPSRETQTV